MYVFVYGTLTEPARVRAVLDSFVFVGGATLTGLRVVEGRYPTLAPPVDGTDVAAVGGRLLRTDGIAALDTYEGVDDGLYARLAVPYDGDADEPDEVAAYVGDPARLGVDARWPGEGAFDDRARRYVREAGVRVRRNR